MSAILRTGLVELPRQVEDEGAAGGIVDAEVADDAGPAAASDYTTTIQGFVVSRNEKL